MNAMVGDWLDVGSVDDVPLRGARTIATGQGAIAVFKAADGTLFALWDKCPHRGGPLSQGIVHGRAVTCPLHNWVISLETGNAMGADSGCVRKLPLKVEAGRICLSAQAVAAGSGT
jgi:nitrite reductase (NADH) small subunit